MSEEPSTAEISTLPGATVLEFGARWCGWCRAAQPLLQEAFRGHTELRHVKIEDGPGRPLGRYFKVRLWPTLVFLKEGRERARLVRPSDRQSIDRALKQILPERETGGRAEPEDRARPEEN